MWARRPASIATVRAAPGKDATFRSKSDIEVSSWWARAFARTGAAAQPPRSYPEFSAGLGQTPADVSVWRRKKAPADAGAKPGVDDKSLMVTRRGCPKAAAAS